MQFFLVCLFWYVCLRINSFWGLISFLMTKIKQNFKNLMLEFNLEFNKFSYLPKTSFTIFWLWDKLYLFFFKFRKFNLWGTFMVLWVVTCNPSNPQVDIEGTVVGSSVFQSLETSSNRSQSYKTSFGVMWCNLHQFSRHKFERRN